MATQLLNRVFRQKIRLFIAFIQTAITLISIYSVLDFNFLKSWKGIAFTGFLGVGLVVFFLVAVNYILKEIHLLPIRDIVLWVIASLVLGGIVSSFLPQPVKPITLITHSVTIESLNTSPQLCNPVELTGFRVDGEFISYAAFENQGWIREGTRMIAQTGENTLKWSGYARSIVISLTGMEGNVRNFV